MLENDALMPGRPVTGLGGDDEQRKLQTEAGPATLPTRVTEKVYVSRE
jgi:hypothetical protein